MTTQPTTYVSFGSCLDVINRFGDDFRHVHQSRNDQKSGGDLRLSKVEGENRLYPRILFILDDCLKFGFVNTFTGKPEKVAILEVESSLDFLTEDFSNNIDQILQKIRSKLDISSDGYDEPVFVTNIQPMHRVKIVIPAMVGLKIANSSLDVFSGALYFSALERRFKSIHILSEGELDRIRISDGVSDNTEYSKIEGSTKIVDCISNDKGKYVWDGIIGLDSNNDFVCFWVVRNNDLKRIFREEFGKPIIKITDVMLGPFNLES